MIAIGFCQSQCLLNAQPGSPQNDDQAAKSPAVRVVAGRAHHRDDLLNLRRIGRIPNALVARRTAGVRSGIVAGERRRPARSSNNSGHDTSAGS
jgi:hypothetical protein